MSLVLNTILCALLTVTTFGSVQAQQQPQFATTKVEGTENVYVFRYANS